MLLEADLLGLLLIVDILGIIQLRAGFAGWYGFSFGAPEMDASKPALHHRCIFFTLKTSYI